MSGPPNKRLKSDAPLSPINDQREEELERLSTGQQTRLAKIIEAIIPSRLSQDDEVRAALDKPSEKIFQFNLNVKDDLIRELKTAPDGIGRLQHSFKRKGMQAVEISADSDTQHRFSLFKSLSLLLTGNETKVMRLLIDAAVSYMWKQQQQYSTPTMISWTTNHPPVGLLPTSNFVKYLSYLSEGKAFPYYPVLQALASCLNLEIWVWNLNSQYQRSFHVFSSSEAQPARTLFLVRERLHNDHSNYRPILPVDLGDEEPQAGPSQSFSQIQADLEGPRPNGDQVLDLPGIGRKRVDDVLNEFWPLEDDQGFFVRVTQEGDEYVARKYRGRRQDRLVESAVFPKRFNVDFIARAPSEPVRRQTSVLDRTRRLRSSSVRKTAEKEVKEEALPKWLDLELLPLLQSLGVSVSSFKEKVYADGRLDQADFASLADHDAVVDVLNKEVADKLSAYVHHRIPVVLAGETKAGKSTTINKIIQSTLISEDDWQQTIASLPDFVDSGLGSPIDDEDERYISYEGDPEDVLPSSTKPTTTRHAQIVEASRGIVAFTVTFWDINELDAQLSLVEACFATAREYWEDDEERQGDIFAAVKEEFEKNDQIRLTAAELVSMLGLRRDSDLWKLEKIDLPEKLRTELTSKPTKKTCFFRKDTLAESLQAMHNEYLRLLVDDDHLNGFLKTAIIQIPLRYCLRLIDVPGLQERDPYGYGIAIRALKGGYGDFDTMLFVFGDSLPSADVTFALRQGRLGSRMMERDLQIIDFMPVDKAPAFSTPKKQQEKKGKKLEVHIRDQSREHEDYLLDIICRDQGSGICSELLDITDEERARREDLVRMGIRHLAVNVLLENPEAQVGSVESLVDVLVQFTGHKWKESVAALYRQAINELSVITRLLFNFAAVGSEETVRTLIYHIKSLAETYGRPNVIKAVKNQIEGPLTSTWDAKAIKRVSDPIIDVCDRPRMMSDEFSDLRAAYTTPRAKKLAVDLRREPISDRYVNTTTGYVIDPLKELMVDQLVEVIFARFKSETDHIMEGLDEVLEGNFETGIDDEDPEQKELAKRILTDRRKQLFETLKKTRDKILRDRKVDTKEVLDDALVEQINHHLGNLYHDTKKMKRKASKTVNETKLENLIDYANNVATSVAKPVIEKAQQIVKEISSELVKALTEQFDKFRKRFSSLSDKDIKAYVRRQASPDFVKKTAFACDVLVKLCNVYAKTFVGEADELPVLLQEASDLEDQKAWLEKYRALAARHLPR